METEETHRGFIRLPASRWDPNYKLPKRQQDGFLQYKTHFMKQFDASIQMKKMI
jgi:hypothetical protein